jgi:hypothetical protein
MELWRNISMASLIVKTEPWTEIDYSLVDGRVREFTLKGDVLYSEYTGVNTEGWESKLIEFIIARELNMDYTGLGLHYFVIALIERGVLNEVY